MTPIAALSREMILSTPDNPGTFEAVAVPEWGGTVYVRPMSGARRDRFELAVSKEPGNNLRARLVAYAACDEAGKYLFEDADIAALGEQSGIVLDRIFDAAVRLNKLNPKDVDAAEKN